MPAPRILQTKLFAPSYYEKLIKRPRLEVLLDRVHHYRICLVQAPAGYGKTSLVAQWLTGQDQPFAWLSLDRADNDEHRFMSYLLAALGQLVPDISILKAELHETPIDEVFMRLINSLMSLEQDAYLVLDDYHVIDQPHIDKHLATFLDYLPPRLHIIMTSRTSPELGLSRLRVRKQLLDISVNELRFDSEESRLFFLSMGLDLSGRVISRLEEKTEGWAASLQLAGLSLQNKSDKAAFVEHFTGRNELILDYLAKEVLQEQQLEVQQFLLKTAFLYRFNSALASAVTGVENVSGILEAIRQAQLFVVPLDQDEQWFRYHHLFADFLQQQLRSTRPEQVADIHAEASAWFEAQGLSDEAIRHVIAGGDIERAVELVEHHSKTVMWNRDDRPTLRQWLNALPLEVVRASARLSLDKAWLLASSQASESWMEDAARALEAIDTSNSMHAELLILRAERCIAKGETEQALTLLEHATGLLKGRAPQLMGIAEQTRGYLLRINGEVREAEQALRTAVQRCRSAGNLIGELASLCDLAEVLKIQGRLDDARYVFIEAINLARVNRQQIAHTGSAALIGLADVLREQYQLDLALDAAQEGLAISQRVAYTSIEVYGHEILARIYLEWQQIEEARSHLESILQLSAGLQSTPRRLRIEAHCTPLWYALGESAKAQQWRHIYQLEDMQVQEREYIALARIELHQKQPEQALNLLKQLAVNAKVAGRVGRLIEINILMARAEQQREQEDAAITHLEEALSLASPHTYLHCFVSEGESLKHLLQAALPKTAQPRYVAKLLQHFPSSSEQASQDLLTKRELEILELIAEGLSNEAIANTLIRSIGTVKAHSSSIYSKLGVASRTEAVARARELGLLS